MNTEQNVFRADRRLIYSRIEIVKANEISFWKYRVRVADKEEFQQLVEAIFALPEALTAAPAPSRNGMRYVGVIAESDGMKIVKSLPSLSTANLEVAHKYIERILRLKEK